MSAEKLPPIGSFLKDVKIINDAGLTLNKVYILKRIKTNGLYEIENDLGTLNGYYSYRFEVLDSKAAKILYGANND